MIINLYYQPISSYHFIFSIKYRGTFTK